MEEALGALRQSIRRRIRMAIGLLVLSSLVFGPIVPLTAREDDTWWVWTVLQSAVTAAVWGAIMWFSLGRSDMEWVTRVDRLDHLVPAEVSKVGPGKRLTVQLSTGEQLVWRTRHAARLAVAQQVWLVPPVETQLAIVTVAPSAGANEPDVLWPREPSRTPGRWDW